MSPVHEEIARRLEAHGVRVSWIQLGQLAGYVSLLRQWNAKINLTTLTSGDAALDRLLVEPILAATFIEPRSAHLVDLGSGGGSPAIPLKIMRPDLRLTMVEVRARKSAFLREVARHLGLEATSVATSRFEEVLRNCRVAAVDVISVRAVRLDATQLQLCADTLGGSGQLLWFLGPAQGTPTQLPARLSESRLVPLVPQTGSQLLVLSGPRERR